MSLFVDTSAVFAYLVETETSHAAVRELLADVVTRGETLLATSYVVVESSALLQRRIGMAAVRDLDAMLPLITVEHVDSKLHGRAWARLLREDRRGLSFVDCVSFELMRARGVSDAATLDRHFAEAGFRILPSLLMRT